MSPASPPPAATTAAAETPHLIIPFAACDGQAWAAAIRALPPSSLVNLSKLLQGMKLSRRDEGSARSLTPPHETVLARAAGLEGSDGLLPWAALEAQRSGAEPGKAWAWLTPCHWAMGREHASLSDPAALALGQAEAQTLLAAMQPYFATEGITLHAATPGRWLAEGELLRDLPTASLDRVLGRNVDAWLPATTTAGSLRRLQNEMQMLLYTHPLNEERALQRKPPVNSFWLSGSGALPAGFAAPASHAEVPRQLAQAAFTDDSEGYAAAWAALDAGPVAALLEQQRAGRAVRLSLCGEGRAFTYDTAAAGLAARFVQLFKPLRAGGVLEQLQT